MCSSIIKQNLSFDPLLISMTPFSFPSLAVPGSGDADEDDNFCYHFLMSLALIPFSFQVSVNTSSSDTWYLSQCIDHGPHNFLT